MPELFQPRIPSAHHLRVLVMSVVWMGALTAYALAQNDTPSPEPKGKLEVRSKGDPGQGLTPNAGVEAVKKAAGQTATRLQPGSEFTMDPGAKWACDQQTVSAEPVWRGQKDLTFTFDIRNEGTADLLIRAKGG